MEKSKARNGLTLFSGYIDPSAVNLKGENWYAAAHLRRIAHVLERVERGELKRVIISVPPRHWKSSLSSVKFPLWWLGKHPSGSIIVASYALSLAEKYSKAVREGIQGNGRYKTLYPDVRIRRDSNSASDWLLESGYQTTLRAVGTGGGIAGYGFKLALLDDVSDPNKQSSATETTNDWEWYKNVIRTRAEPDAAIVIVNNRVGVNDLVGYLLDPERNDSADPPEDWTYIEIPAQDEQGDYLWLDRFGSEYYVKLQNDVHLWRVQYQQQPTTEAGTLIKREWFERHLPSGEDVLDVVDTLPSGVQWKVIPFDVAFTAKQSEKHDPDFTAHCKMTFANNILWIGDPELFRKDIDDTVRDIVSLKMEYPHLRMGMGRVGIRAKIIKALNSAGYNITEFPETGDPVAESTGWRNLAKQGRVRLVGSVSKWEKIMAQWTKFPVGHDDTVAMVSIGYDMLGNPLASVTLPPSPVVERNDWMFAEE